MFLQLAADLILATLVMVVQVMSLAIIVYGHTSAANERAFKDLCLPSPSRMITVKLRKS